MPDSSTVASSTRSAESAYVSRVRDTAALRRELTKVVGDRVEQSRSAREHHAKGEGFGVVAAPDLVVYATSTEEVSAVINVCARHDAPIVPFGAGTSFEGQVAAIHGGVALDMTRMSRILRVSVDDLDATVEAGVTRTQLTHALRSTGATLFVDPGADATIGGMAATGASGTTTVRYGTMRENVLGLTVVLADGRVIHTGGRARKSSAGYDLTRLFIGSEGTLGVITEVTIKLHPIPAAISAASCVFATIEGAMRAVVQTILVGVPVARVELVDEVAVDSFNRHAGSRLPLAPTLFFEFHGLTSASVAEQAAVVEDIARQHGGSCFTSANTADERARIWDMRHRAYFAALALRPGARGWPTDVCVPISRLADCILETKADMSKSTLRAPLVGHVGDGNFHLLYLIDPANAAEIGEAHRLYERLVTRALAMEGTCTGEHGVGFGKMRALAVEHADAIDTMRAIKLALDPRSLMNPGKIVTRNGEVPG